MTNPSSEENIGLVTQGDASVGEDVEDASALQGPNTPDPGEAVAAVLVRRLLDAEPGLRERAAGCGRAVVVEVSPGAEWLAPMAAAWVDQVWGADALMSAFKDVVAEVRPPLCGGGQ